MEVVHRNPLDNLVGQQLFAVKFVLDYIQLEFGAPSPDGLVLTLGVPPATITAPRVELKGPIFMWGDTGYRDTLCASLGAVVHEVIVLADWEIVLKLDNEASIFIPVHSTRDSDNPSIIFHDGHLLQAW